MRTQTRITAVLTAMLLMLGFFVPQQARAESTNEESVAQAATWIADTWHKDPSELGAIGGKLDAIIALSAVHQKPEVVDELIAALQKNVHLYVDDNPAGLGKTIIALGAAGKDPATTFPKAGDLVAKLKADAANPEVDVTQYWAPYLVAIALGREGEPIPARVVDAMLVNQKNGGFGYDDFGTFRIDPDYTAMGIMAMLHVANSEHADDATAAKAKASLDAAIAWAKDPANQEKDAAGNIYWVTTSAANSTGMMASALADAGEDITSPVKFLKAQQTLTKVGAWQSGAGSTDPNMMATTQAILGVAGVGYSLVGLSDEIVYNFTDDDVTACLTAQKVFVIVDPGEDQIMGGCADKFATGHEALVSAGFTPNSDSFVTEIDGYRADYVADGKWWTYWHRNADESGAWADWEFSQAGLGQYQPKPGSIEGWSISPASGANVEPAYDPLPLPVPGDCTVTFATAGAKLVGNGTNAWGTATDCTGPVTVEKKDGDKWVKIGEAVAADNGFYKLSLAPLAEAGTYTLRAVVDGVTAAEASFQRVARTTVSAAATTLVGRGSNVWGAVDGSAKVSTQVWIDGKGWSTSQTRDVTGGYVIPLTYGLNSAGTYKWRVVVDHAHGEREIAGQFTQRRLAVPTASSAATASVGRTSNVWGTVDGQSGAKVWTEVKLPGGTWSRSQVGTTKANGGYVLELTYGKNSAGTHTFRVGAEYAGFGTLYSKEFTLVRK